MSTRRRIAVAQGAASIEGPAFRPVDGGRAGLRPRPAGPVGDDNAAVCSGSTVDDWLRATASGDVTAFNQLFTVLRPMVIRRAQRVLIDTSQAEEVAQEVMLEVWLKASAFNPARGSAWGWITHIAHRRAIDRVRQVSAVQRREQRAFHHDRVVFLDTDPPVVVQPDKALAVAVGQLSAAQRQALTWAFGTELTYAASALALGVPVGTFKTRVRDALKRLRVVMVDAAACQEAGQRVLARPAA
jgi:RNA polymerase sigma-70 factor, ECF subfamily